MGSIVVGQAASTASTSAVRQTLTAGFTVTHDGAPCVIVKNATGGALTSSSTTPVQSGTSDGQQLRIEYDSSGSNAAITLQAAGNCDNTLSGNWVTVQPLTTPSANYEDYTFFLVLRWNSATSKWVEVDRGLGVAGGSKRGTNSFVASGGQAIGNYSVCIGPSSANTDYSNVFGVGAKSRRVGEVVHASGRFSGTNGQSQGTGGVQVIGQTTDATPTALVIGLDSTDRFSVVSNSALCFAARVVALQTNGSGECAGWTASGVIRNIGGTTSLLGTTMSLLYKDVAGWDIAIAADDTNDALAVTVTGAVGDTIRWVVDLEYAEVAF